MKKTILFVAVLFILSIADAYAFSCRGRLISIGMQEFEVYDRCGEPSNVRVWQEDEWANRLWPYYPGGYVFVPGPALVTYEEWIYNLGPTHFIQFLTFKNGKLVKTAQGSYGY